LARIFAYAKIVTKPNLGEGWLAQPEPHSRCWTKCHAHSHLINITIKSTAGIEAINVTINVTNRFIDPFVFGMLTPKRI
jgi:hypothetical protein